MVNLHSSKISVISSPHILKVLLVIVWVFGLLFGCYVSLFISPEIQSIIHGITTADTSIVGLIISFFSLLLISAFLFRKGMPLLVLPIIFLKAVCFSYCSSAIVYSLGDAGWLLSKLYMLSNGGAVVVLLWFWLQGITGKMATNKKYIILSIVAICLICYFDCTFVSPFTAMLFDQ